jgi:hypothetical protein
VAAGRTTKAAAAEVNRASPPQRVEPELQELSSAARRDRPAVSWPAARPVRRRAEGSAVWAPRVLAWAVSEAQVSRVARAWPRERLVQTPGVQRVLRVRQAWPVRLGRALEASAVQARAVRARAAPQGSVAQA